MGAVQTPFILQALERLFQGENKNMALINSDWSHEFNQLKEAAGELIDEKISPMLEGTIRQAGGELTSVVTQASVELQSNIKALSEEIHSQRRLTAEDIITLINYASEKIGKTIDERVAQIKEELEDAAIRSRKTLWANIALSVGAALAMAIVGIIYRKISLGELDIFWLFRVLLLSAATGTSIFAFLKGVSQWRALNQTKKNVATVALNYLGAIRPNGAGGLFFIALILAISWFLLTFYIH